MARIKNPMWDGLKLGHGQIAKDFVLKKRNGKAFVCKYPDMSNVVPSELQLKSNRRFADAVAYARNIVNDPVKKVAYKARRGMSVYHSAVKDYLEGY